MAHHLSSTKFQKKYNLILNQDARIIRDVILSLSHKKCIQRRRTQQKTKRTSSTQQATSGAERPLRLRPLNSRSRPMKIQKAFSFLVAAPITEVYRNMVCQLRATLRTKLTNSIVFDVHFRPIRGHGERNVSFTFSFEI